MSSVSFDLSQTNALITGGTSGIGFAIAEALLAHGARVATGSRGDEKVSAARAQLEAAYGQAALVQTLDVARRETIDALMDAAEERFGGLNVLINCAGQNQKKPTVEVTEEEMSALMDVNFTAAFYASQAFAWRVIERGDTTARHVIVNICSVTSFQALTEVTPYACAKSALWALTRQLAAEWPGYGIRVNAIAPGFVPADQNREILRSGDRGRRILEGTPMGRFGDPDEIAGAAVYLCAPVSRFVNGECINVDGGFMATGVQEG